MTDSASHFIPKSWLSRWSKATPEEVPALLWAFAYFFCLLCGYYLLRPVRDEMAIQGGVQHLPWMMTATFLTLLATTPLFGWLSARVPRITLLRTVYLFFATHLVLFYALMASHTEPAWVARVFFVWLSVFNLFVVTVFWSFMADVFTPEQGARLFGAIAAGGSTGALVGPGLAAALTYLAPVAVLMLAAAGLLLACLICIHRLDRWGRAHSLPHTTDTRVPIGGSILAGIRLTFASPYLLRICGYLLLLTMTATFLYLEQARLVGQTLTDPVARTRLFAGIDLVVNAVTLIVQLVVANRIMARWGLGAALIMLPLISLIGFAALGLSHTLEVLLSFVVARRIAEYAIAKPAREVLFTVVSREEKYKAKNFIDTAVSRGGDATSGWLVSGVKSLGATTAHIAWVLVPIALLWSWLGWTLARRKEQGIR